MTGLFAGLATAGLAAAEASAQILNREVYWRGLFDRLSEAKPVPSSSNAMPTPSSSSSPSARSADPSL